MYVGRASLATVVDPPAVASALTRMATQPELRASMGAAGLARARSEFDWPVILERYAQLAEELARIRGSAGAQPAQPSPTRADPFARFAHFSSSTLSGTWVVTPLPDAEARLRELLGLAMANYAFDAAVLSPEAVEGLLAVLRRQGPQTAGDLLIAAGTRTPAGVRALMWLWKFGLVGVQPA